MLSQIDLDALQRAMQIAEAESAGRRQQIEDEERTEPWEDVAMSAAYCCQTAALNLKPWREPPMRAGDDRPLNTDPLMGRLAAGSCAVGCSRRA